MDVAQDLKSPIENLPLELACAIFEYASGSLSDIRMSSPRSLRAQADKYALLPTIFTLVKKFQVSGLEKSNDAVTIVMEVNDEMICRFERRLKILMRSNSHPIKRFNISSGFKSGDMSYNTYIVENVPCFGQVMEILKKSCGTKKVEIYKYQYEEGTVLKLQEGMQFELLEFTIDEFSDENAAAILNIVKMHKIKGLSLTIGLPLMSKPENFLIELSTTVQSLRIRQVWDKRNHDLFFLGRFDFDWAPTILTMFSKQLDKFCIDNANKRIKCIDTLKEKLPIVGKAVWFEAICTRGYYLRYREINDDHSVKTASHFRQSSGYLSPICKFGVKHLSRKEEASDI